ncbi:MAG TPA: glucuronate isomerase [Verrucomicrobiae bacterium]|nr:glucuronate isomerase [Verrucomicrobiae bacterium]
MKALASASSSASLQTAIERAVNQVRLTDIHTHLYDPAFKELLLWGIDELLVYHYLVAEAFRYLEIPYDKFWALSKTAQAELIWEHLFIRHSPVSEACRGVLTTLNLMGLDVKKRDLPSLRRWFNGQKVEDHVTRCFDLARIEKVFMTNSPFDDHERSVWETGFQRDDRFEAGLRIDPLLLGWPKAAASLVKWGYEVRSSPTPKTYDEVRRFLADWTKRMKASYVMVSLGPDFHFPDETVTTQLIERALLPHCREYGLPFALMPGVRRAVNPQLRLAGDGVGSSDLVAIQNLCAGYPENKFMATILARENQHEACVLARKFRNLHLFGCWWFTNVPSLVDEITRMRLELIGLSFTPQHSDARVLDQVVYKWHHFREVLVPVLVDQYTALSRTGWQVTPAEIDRDVKDLFGGGFTRFLGEAGKGPSINVRGRRC